MFFSLHCWNWDILSFSYLIQHLKILKGIPDDPSNNLEMVQQHSPIQREIKSLFSKASSRISSLPFSIRFPCYMDYHFHTRVFLIRDVKFWFCGFIYGIVEICCHFIFVHIFCLYRYATLNFLPTYINDDTKTKNR